MGETEYLLIIIVFNIFLIAFIVASVAFVIQYKNKKRQNTANLRQQQILHQKELLATQMEIQTRTMQHIGREIHDNVGQKLTLASLYTQQLAFENVAPHINDKIEGIGEIINQALAELRHLSKSLTDNDIDNSDITVLLKKEFARIKELKKFEVQLVINFKSISLSYQNKNVILRVAQEFLQNSIKHANCTKIMARLDKEGNLLKIELSDNGKGFIPADIEKNGIGLINMKKRIELIGGTYLLQSNTGEGTKLTIEIAL